MKRLNDSSDFPRARLGILLKTFTSSKKKDKAAFYFHAEEWVFLAASTKEPEDREFVVDSGACMHLVSNKDLKSAEVETMRTSRSSTTVMTADGEVQTTEETTVYVKQLTNKSKFCFLKKLPQFFSCGISVRIMGKPTTGSAVKNHFSSEWQEN